MKSAWNAGDIVACTCPTCRQVVQSRFEFRTIRMERSRLRVPNVLVDVCNVCDNIIAIPSQIAPLDSTRVAPDTIEEKCDRSRSPASFIPLLKIVFPTEPSRTSRNNSTYVLVL